MATAQTPVTLDLRRMPKAIAETVRAVLAQAGALEAVEAAVSTEALDALFHELGNNVAHTVACDCDVENAPDEVGS